jgi:hypothetical protein
MDEEGVSTASTPSTTSTPSISTPESPPMHGTKMRPFKEKNYSSSRERKRPSVFQGDGLDAFIENYCSGDGSWNRETLDTLPPPSPIERYEQDKEVSWQMSGDDDVARDSKEEREE